MITKKVDYCLFDTISDDDFLYELLKDGMTKLLNQTLFDGSKYFVELNLRLVNKETNRTFTAIRTKGGIYER